MQECTAGLDLASEEHRLAIVESNGRRLQERRVAHSEDGIDALVRNLAVLRVARSRSNTERAGRRPAARRRHRRRRRPSQPAGRGP
jgi:hypothetical protein